MKKVSRNLSWEVIKNSLFPVAVLLALIGCYTFYKTNIVPSISEEITKEAGKYISTAFIVSIAIVIQTIIGSILGWYKENVAAETETKLDDKLIPLFQRSIKVIIWVLAFIVILPFYGVNISALVAAMGVSSLAIALAAQDTIANIIAGFLIMVDAPFKAGDRVKIPTGEVVKVLDVGVRRSTFLSEDSAVISLPNQDLSKSKIINYTLGEERKKNEA